MNLHVPRLSTHLLTCRMVNLKDSSVLDIIRYVFSLGRFFKLLRDSQCLISLIPL